MSGKRELNPKSKKGKMARRLVVHCIVILTVTAIWAMILETVAAFHEIDIDQSEVLVFVGGAFGGELLMLLVKRIFGKPTETEE